MLLDDLVVIDFVEDQQGLSECPLCFPDLELGFQNFKFLEFEFPRHLGDLL